MHRRDRAPALPRVGLATVPRSRSFTRAFGALAAAGTLSLTAIAHANPSELPPEVGYNYGEIETPRIAAIGGGLRATSIGTSALFQNPANMAAARVYHVTGFAQIWPQASRQSYGAAAVDSIGSSTGLAGGLGGTWNQQDPDGIARQYNDIHFALAMPFGNTFFVGLGGRMLSLSQDGDGPLGASRASGGLQDERIVQTFTFDAGATLRPVPQLSLSVVGHNLTNTGLGYAPLMLGGAVGYGTKDFNVEGDVVMDTTTWDRTTLRINGGGEALVGDHVGLRLGYRWDQGVESHAVSGGIAYIDPRFEVDASVRQTLSGGSSTAIILGLTLHIENSGLSATQTTDF